MIALLQRVRSARVEVQGAAIAAIEQGLLVFIGVERGDTEQQGRRLWERIVGYRVFADAAGKMNLSLKDVAGAALLVPQFTLAADTRQGRRPSFSSAAAPADGERLFAALQTWAQQDYGQVVAGQFGADMQVHLVNDGPVTFSLRVAPAH